MAGGDLPPGDGVVSAEVDFPGLIEPVARDLFRDRPVKLVNGHELRFGNHESFSVVIGGPKRGTWHDFEAGVGGGTIDLVRHVKGGTKADALAWLRSQG